MPHEQLPLYGNPHPPRDVILNDDPGVLEGGIRTARESAEPYLEVVRASSRRGREWFDVALAHSRDLYARISDESSTLPKAAAITGGGLVGLLISSRKGFFKKILYTSIGLGAAAAACYPQQSRELVDLTAYIARRKGPEIIRELTGVDVAPYLDIKKLGDGSSSDSSPASSTTSSRSSSPGP